MSVALVPAERDFRGPGCGPDCRAIRALLPGQFGRSDILLHDPEAHETWGWGMADARAGTRDLVVTGRMVVDLGRLDVLVDGVSAGLTATELRIVVVLAKRLGRTVEHAEILREVWGESVREMRPQDQGALLKCNVNRVRARLGVADGLIVTSVGLGYRLDLVEAGATTPRFSTRGLYCPRIEGWARNHAKCLGCGTTNRPHYGHGYCDRCRNKRKRKTQP